MVIHHSGGDDWGAVHRSELLSLVWYDPHRGRGDIRPFSPLHDCYHCYICRGLDDTAHIDYVTQRIGCNRRAESPTCWTFRLDDSEEYSRQSHHLNYFLELSVLPSIR